MRDGPFYLTVSAVTYEKAFKKKLNLPAMLYGDEDTGYTFKYDTYQNYITACRYFNVMPEIKHSDNIVLDFRKET